MTGYGTASGENEELKIDVEIKSLNSKFLDLNLRLPRFLQPLEMDIRNLVNRKLKRGKAQLGVNLQMLDVSQVKRSINSSLFHSYREDIQNLAKEGEMDASGLMGVLMGLPDVLEPTESELSEDSSKLVMSVVTEALDNLHGFRADEGAVLKGELSSYAKTIGEKLKQVDSIKDSRLDAVKARLKELTEKYLSPEKIDQNRFEQELVYYMEKLEITEEIVRLTGHIDYYEKELNGQGSGKKLGFIAQEMGREINTIGSKANDEQIQHLVVEMKEELEKIKEQVLNIL